MEMRRITDKQLTGLLLLFALLAGIYVRLAPVIRTGFPLNDGGLFYSMVSDLIQSEYALPYFTTYNHSNIPFAYPPLPIYLTAGLTNLLHLSLIELIHWLPVFFSLLTIPAFFLLARAMIDSPSKAALATFIYALLPRSYDWIIMGGGVTRAPAALFLILMTWAVYRAFREKSWKMPLAAAIFGALVVWSHPERALHAVAIGILFWLSMDRSRIGTIKAAAIGMGVLILTIPWWGIVLARYGANTLWLASQAAGPRWLFWIPSLQLSFTDESAPLCALLAIIGCLICWHQKKRLLPLWFILTFVVDPRSAPHVLAPLVAILATLGLTEVIFPALGRLTHSESPTALDWSQTLNGSVGRFTLGYVLIVMLFNAQWNLLTLQNYVLSSADHQALTWIAAETPFESRFLVMNWQETPTLSPLLEWFPALSARTSISTLQGREWLPGTQNFSFRMRTYPDLHNCLYQDTICLDTWAAQNEDTFNFVYLSLNVLGEETPRFSSLYNSLFQSAKYELVYETQTVKIFQHSP